MGPEEFLAAKAARQEAAHREMDILTGCTGCGAKLLDMTDPANPKPLGQLVINAENEYVGTYCYKCLAPIPGDVFYEPQD